MDAGLLPGVVLGSNIISDLVLYLKKLNKL